MDRHTMMVRRRIAAGVGVVVLIAIVLVVNGCLKSGKEEALKTYNREVGQLVGESDQQVSQPLFAALASAGGESPLNVELKVNQLRETAQQQATHAKGLSVPGEMQAAQRNLSLTLDLRAEALVKIANLVRTALGGQGKQASTLIAGAMEMFLASDVVHSQRTAPLIQQALAADGIHGVGTAGTQFLPNVGWLEPSTVQQRLTGKSSASSQNGQAAPGTHGSALLGVSAGGTTLEAPPAINHLGGGANPTFTVKVEDSGSNTETDVKVEVAVTAGGRQYKDTRAIEKTEPGVTSSVDIPVEGVPQGSAARINIYVQPVAGETNVENNKGSYLAVFGG
ncbi:MAG TPA: hypothetical protein VNY52_09340 [Solirubrobacteraceae bacterium]|jgi:hypothetical protein|nr:hypothetical protein [Solirubrobacteraceae bacterium]